jgi:hypothetical protein
VTLVLLVVAVLVALTLTYVALHFIKPKSFKLSASVLKMFTFSLEMTSGDDKPGWRRGGHRPG